MSAVIKLSSPATQEFWEIPVLYEDEHLLALDKPVGLPVSPLPEASERPSLLALLYAGIAQGKPWAQTGRRTWLKNANQLEPEAGGVFLLAKSREVLAKLMDWFGAEKPGPVWTVLAQGSPEEDRFEIDARLAPHPVHPEIMRVDPRRGKRSRTVCEVLESFSDWTLLRCETLTDRPHQVRVHLRHAGFPVVGDSLYGGRPLLLSRLKSEYHLKPNQTERPLMSRPAVHLESISLPHPMTGQPVTIQSPWPKDLAVAIKYLRRYASSPLAPGS